MHFSSEYPRNPFLSFKENLYSDLGPWNKGSKERINQLALHYALNKGRNRPHCQPMIHWFWLWNQNLHQISLCLFLRIKKLKIREFDDGMLVVCLKLLFLCICSFVYLSILTFFFSSPWLFLGYFGRVIYLFVFISWHLFLNLVCEPNSCYCLLVGKVTIQEFRKLPTAAMDDYMNKLKELSPVHRERNSHQTWLHQGKFASKIMQRLRERWS